MEKEAKIIGQMMHFDIEQVFNDVKNNTFSSGTIDALARFYDIMHVFNEEKSSISTPDGLIGVAENGVGFRLHDSDDDFHYCAECREITKHTIKHSSEVIHIDSA
jgi:hypothetical protein